jgi:NodT family efflux transporter outer membrane factor (OMF) lipoprotein
MEAITSSVVTLNQEREDQGQSNTRCSDTSRAKAAAPLRRISFGLASLACCLTLSLLSGCTSFHEYVNNGFKVGPNYLRPTAPVERDWIDVADKRIASEPIDMSQWWSMFQDPVLDSLIMESYDQNLSLREAGFRVLQARAQRNIQVGNLFPQTQTAFGGYNRSQISKRNANTSFIPTRFYNQFNVGFNLSWELDFWGRFRRAVEAAEGDLDASVEGYDAVLVTLQGDIAEAYVEIRTIERQMGLVSANVELQRQTLDLTEARAKAGLTSELDLAQAKSNLAQTQSLLPQFKGDVRVATNRLSVLLGLPPTKLEARLGVAPIPKAPPAVAIGIPADLLARRPDVRRAERIAAAQSARIGIATADLYPRISIIGTIGSSSARFQSLLQDESFYGSIGPSYQWNILNYGRLKNNIRLQDARFQELVATYQQTVLKAEEEAENGLVRYLTAQERAAALAESVTESEKAVQLALTQYKGGLVDFNRVALLELNLVQQQDLLAQAQGNIATGLIDAYRALGGGWEHRLTADTNSFEAVAPQTQKPAAVDGEITVPIPEPAVEPVPVPAAPAN